MSAAVPTMYPLTRSVPFNSAKVLRKQTDSDEKTQKGFKVGSPSEKHQKCSFPNCTTEITPELSLAVCLCEKTFCRVHRKPSEHRCPVSLKNMS